MYKWIHRKYLREKSENKYKKFIEKHFLNLDVIDIYTDPFGLTLKKKSSTFDDK